MIKNFVTDIDIETYYRKIGKILKSGDTSFEVKRMQAFDLVLDDFRFRSIDARKLHIPLDLNRPTTTTTTQVNLIPFTKTATFTSEYILGQQGFKRFVVGISAITSGTTITYNMKFQGSNDSLRAEANWEEIGNYNLTATGNTTIVSQIEYYYYRYVLTVGTGGSITFTVGLYETWVDRLIINKTLELIFFEMIMTAGDVWDIRCQQAKADYELVMQTAKYFVDTGNALPEEEEDTGTAAITFMR